MPVTYQQCGALLDAIAAAPSVHALRELRREAGQLYGPDVAGSFVELLIDLRRTNLERVGEPPASRRGFGDA